mmetsp:Transcript_43778/g.133218  ORF Transcript_43778/g.133218 Transcript_43778/m.133218 type:complete len:271 (+) Transcript_43778:371-1183(+)
MDHGVQVVQRFRPAVLVGRATHLSRFLACGRVAVGVVCTFLPFSTLVGGGAFAAIFFVAGRRCGFLPRPATVPPPGVLLARHDPRKVQSLRREIHQIPQFPLHVLRELKSLQVDHHDGGKAPEAHPFRLDAQFLALGAERIGNLLLLRERVETLLEGEAPRVAVLVPSSRARLVLAHSLGRATERPAPSRVACGHIDLGVRHLRAEPSRLEIDGHVPVEGYGIAAHDYGRVVVVGDEAANAALVPGAQGAPPSIAARYAEAEPVPGQLAR